MSKPISRHPSARRELPIAGKLLMIATAILLASLWSDPRATAGEDPPPQALDIKHPHQPTVPVHSESVWDLVWVDGFDDGSLDGWTCRTFTSDDIVELVQDGDGWCLHAVSRGGGHGCGYIVESPDLDTQGVNYFQTYRIDLRFKVPEACNLGTTILRSQGVTLVMDEVNPVSLVARLGWTDEFETFHRLGQIQLGQWNTLRVVVSPFSGRPTWSVFRVSLNGRYLGGGEVLKSPWKNIALLHPPFEAVGAGRPSGEMTGGGFWDDFAVYTRNDPPEGGGGTVKIVPTVAPNPSNPSTAIRFDLPREAQVTVDVFTVDGRRVIRLWNGWMSAGPQSFIWNGTDALGKPVSSGIYYGRILTPETAHTVRMTVLK